MKIVSTLIPESTLTNFATLHHLTLEMHERSQKLTDFTGFRFYCSFKNAEVGDRGLLKGAFGSGHTKEEAMIDYAREISETELIIGAFSPERRTLQVPRLTGI